MILGILLLTFFALCISHLSNTRHPVWSGLGLLLCFGLLSYILNFEVVPFVLNNKGLVLEAFGVYLVAGVPWAFIKWWRYALSRRRLLEEWLGDHPMPAIGQDNDHSHRPCQNGYPEKDETESAYSHRKDMLYVQAPVFYDRTSKKFVLLASRNKELILTWLAFWPFSIVGTLLSDVLLRWWEILYTELSTLFQRISDSVFSDINEDR